MPKHKKWLIIEKKIYQRISRRSYRKWDHPFTQSTKISSMATKFRLLQGLFVPFACVGSGDPVRVVRLYTTNTLNIPWSIYCWDICTTCRYRIYVLCAQALQLWDFLLLIRTLLKYLAKCALTLYCVVTYIAACVDASRTVFWDRSLRLFLKAGLFIYIRSHKSLNLYNKWWRILCRQNKM